MTSANTAQFRRATYLSCGSPGRVVGGRVLFSSNVIPRCTMSVAASLSFRVARATSDVITRSLIIARTSVVVCSIPLHTVRQRICGTQTGRCEAVDRNHDGHSERMQILRADEAVKDTSEREICLKQRFKSAENDRAMFSQVWQLQFV